LVVPQVKIMFVSAIMAASIFVILPGDHGLEAVWETLLAFQVARTIGITYRYFEPYGPLIERKRVIEGKAFR